MEENPPEFIITKHWRGSFNRLCNDFFPEHDIIVFKSIKTNRPHMLMFLEKLIEEMRYMKKSEEWEEQEEIDGRTRKIIKIKVEKIGACRR